jgi:hypothetical protein
MSIVINLHWITMFNSLKKFIVILVLEVNKIWELI